jgi:hypothetical protein
MENTKKYAEESALKWQAEDFDGTLESMLDSDEITKETFSKLVSLDQAEKLEIIESAIGTISSYLCEIIFDAIREEIKMY